jgi:putative Holliday junction resolvase
VRVGLALSDDEGLLGPAFARPLATVDARRGDPAKGIAEHALREEVGEIVVGLPLSLDGKEHGAARAVRALVARLAKLVTVPIVLWDERLTTAEALRALAASEVRGAKKRALVDRVAATLILQSYLDAQSSKGERTWDDDAAPAPPAKPARRSRER